MEIRLVGFPLFSPHDIRYNFTIDFKVCKVQPLYDVGMRQLHHKHVVYFLATFAYFPRERITHTTSSTTPIGCKLIISTTWPNLITGQKFEIASLSPLQILNIFWPIFVLNELLTRWAMHNLPSNTLDGHACKYFVIGRFKCCVYVVKFLLFVDRFLVWIPIKKTTQRRLSQCHILHLGITIRLIDRSQGWHNKISRTNQGETTFEVSFGTY